LKPLELTFSGGVSGQKQYTIPTPVSPKVAEF
jgi:hypothetical protein